MCKEILKIIRIHIVLGGILAFTLGALLALVNGGTLDPLQFIIFYLIVFFGDLSTHYSNDCFDAAEDRPQLKRLFSGNKILVHHPNLRPTALKTSLAFLSISVLIATLAVLSQKAPVELLLITLGANFLGWFYSAPPLRLVSRGLGEVAIALAAGFAIPAVGYLAVMGRFDSLFGFFVFPFVLYGFILALSLQAPDVQVDRLGSKKTLGVMYGVRAVFGLVFATSLAAMLIFLFYAWQIEGLIVNFWVVFAFSILPLAAGLLGFICPCKGKMVVELSAANVVSLFAFNLLMVAYLIVISLILT